MKTEEFLRPTRKNPVFVADCDWFGFIEENLYKRWELPDRNGTIGGNTFSLHFTDAITRLHEWIIENKHVLKEYPKSKFSIYLINGSFNRFKEVKHQKVYTITARNAAKLLF
jgi:hypothetical protein